MAREPVALAWLRSRAGMISPRSRARINHAAMNLEAGSPRPRRVIVAGAVAALGGLDILVNAAGKPGGQAAPPKLAEITDALFWDDVNVKVMGYLRVAREAAPHMAANRWGRIINISGLAARSTGSTIGSMRNVAVAALTKNLADELYPTHIIPFLGNGFSIFGAPRTYGVSVSWKSR